MKDFIFDTVAGAALGVVIGLGLLLFGFSQNIENKIDQQWQKEAIERDFGEYCSRTGEWSWIGECEQ